MVEEIIPKELWKLKVTYVVLTKKGPIVISSGFEFDQASVGIARLLISKTELGILSTLTHDWLYRNKGGIGDLVFTRKEADHIFLEHMRVLGISRWKRLTAYHVIRAVSWMFWG